MIANRFRNIARAMSFAALLAATAISTVAAAAPAESLPLPSAPETVLAAPIIKIPQSDAAVSFVGTWSTSGGGRAFAFHVENNGPSAATITIKKTLYRGYCLDPNAPSCHVGTDVAQQTLDLQSGGSYEALITCHYEKCGTVVEVKAEKRLDPNSANNTVAYWNFYGS